MVIYTKISNKRKPEFRIATTIENINNKFIVRKSALSEISKKHCLSFKDKYSILKKLLKEEVVVVEPLFEESTTIFPFIEGKILLQEFINYYKIGKEEKAVEILEKIKNIINIIPIVELDFPQDIKFQSFFGKSNIKKEKCSKTGFIDFNLDNFIVKNGKLTLFDYEWELPTFIPRDYLHFRVVYYAYSSIKELLSQKVSSKEPMIKLYDDVLIPQKIYNKEKYSEEKINRFFQYESKFQKYVNGKPYPKETNFNEVVKEKISPSRLLNEKNNLEETLTKYKNEQEKYKTELEKTRFELNNVYNSKPWKIFKPYRNIKEKIKHIKKD